MDRDAYLEHIGVPHATVDSRKVPGMETLRRLQHAHVTTIPFETLAINGDPFREGDDGEGVSLTLPALHEKIVERERGGFCFELNGLFGWLLSDLGFDADRVAARVVNESESRPPANHHTHLVHLDRTYVVDVGLGTTAIRRPIPVDGTTVTDEAGFTWRVVESDRPNADYSVEYREPAGEWDERYFFRTTPRTLSHFAATCEYLATDPESGFVGDPVVTIATADGYAKLGPDTLTRLIDGEEDERHVAKDEWHDVLEREFGLVYGSH